MKKKQALLALALIGCLLLTSACTLHVDRDPWPSNDQTAATAEPAATEPQDAAATEVPLATATPDPAVTPLSTVDPNADPGMNG